MDEDIVFALAELRGAIKQQNELQEKANGIMRGLVEAMKGVAQETLELRQHLESAAKK